MSAYPDTSFLCALYRRQDNSERALNHRQRLREPLPVTQLLLWEFRQAARFQVFRHSRDKTAGFPMHEAEKMLSDLEDDLVGSLVVINACDPSEVVIIAERISKLRTVAGGHRSLDILHVATAVTLGARAFLSFDGNQNALAAAEGLDTPLALE